ncbi:MAG: hypothetical protein IKH88_10030 [Prevotella sp.]|nr:hypothetical protein [Prevotella sp.]
MNPHLLDLTLFAEQQKVAQDFAISNNSLALVMQLKSSKKNEWHGKGSTKE